MDQYVRLALIVGALGIGLVFLKRRPNLAVVLWMCTVCFVPVWLGVTIRVYFVPAILVAVYVLFIVLPTRVRAIGLADLGVVFLTVVCLVPIVVGGSSGPYLAVLISQWLLAFTLGRVLPTKVDLRWIYGCVAVTFSGVAVLAILEYLLDWNPFVKFSADNRLFDTWGPILVRGGVPRVEGAFGHPIALGVSIAIAIPLVFASRFRAWLKLAMAALLTLAIIPTFSRSAMACAGLSIVLSLVFAREGLSLRVRAWSLVVIGSVAVAVIPLVAKTFADAGTEASNSAVYRGSLLSLVPRMSIIGFSTSAQRNASGDLFFGDYKSIDSAGILLGLTFGAMALLIAGILLLAAILRVLSRRGNAPTVAVVAAIPALATVAFITQYQMFFWFLAGLAVYAHTEQMSRRHESTRQNHPSGDESAQSFTPSMIESVPFETGDRQAEIQFNGSIAVKRNG